MAGIAHSS